MGRIVGAFIFPDVWEQWTEDEAKQQLDNLAGFGVNAIFTESETYRDDLIEWTHERGFRWFGAIACFSDHANDHQLLRKRPELWPVEESGRPRPQMEWYIGVTPTFNDYNQSILERAQRVVEAHSLDGLFLDFIRWPIHWELEARAGAPTPSQSSFDLMLGLYVPPLPCDELESWAGQRLSELSSLVDVISPMAYHAILHRSPPWVGEVIADLSTQVHHPLLPVLQVDSEGGKEAGADWGPPIPLEEWESVVRLVSESPTVSGLVAFTGTALLGEGRGESLLRSWQQP
jgi:hypothetical protein